MFLCLSHFRPQARHWLIALINNGSLYGIAMTITNRFVIVACERLFLHTLRLQIDALQRHDQAWQWDEQNEQTQMEWESSSVLHICNIHRNREMLMHHFSESHSNRWRCIFCAHLKTHSYTPIKCNKFSLNACYTEAIYVLEKYSQRSVEEPTNFTAAQTGAEKGPHESAHVLKRVPSICRAL